MAGFAEYDQYDAVGLAELVRDGQVSPVELVEEAIARAEKVNGDINAIVRPMYETARETAKDHDRQGPFAGVPFLLKDLLADYAGVPTSCGSRYLNDFIQPEDSELVRRIKAAGLIVFGKTNSPEFGLLPVTEPKLFGPARNPWDPIHRTTGGSSGGSGAAVAARILPMAGAGDGGGSIRIPASCNGIFGLKPTRGRNPFSPDLSGYWHGAVQEHVLTRSVRDSAALLDAVHGVQVDRPFAAPPPGGNYRDEVDREPGKLRIAYSAEPLLKADVHPDCLAALDDAVALCRELGHELIEDHARLDGEALARNFVIMGVAELDADLRVWETRLGRAPTRNDVEIETWLARLIGRATTAGEFGQAQREMNFAARQLNDFMADYDVVLSPTLALPPVEHGALAPKGAEAIANTVFASLGSGRLLRKLGAIDLMAGRAFAFIPFTPAYNVSGQPAMSVPLYWSQENLPIGVQFAGRYGDEATLFRLAGQLERARPWADRRPGICA